MNPHDNTHEQLMHRVLDGECTPAEAKQLALLLETDDRMRARFHDLKAIHQHCEDAVAQGILAQGKTAQDVIHAAQRQVCIVPGQPNAFKRFLGSQFASGLAAGLLLATLLLTWFDRNPTTSPQTVADNVSLPQAGEMSSPRPFDGPTIPVGNTIQHGIDLYDFTDNDGNRWLFEGMREDSAPPDVNRQDF